MTEKRKAESSPDPLNGIKALILDIEGTTTPISFVKDILFPYVSENIEEYIESCWDEEECQADIDALRVQAEADKDLDGAVPIPNKSGDGENDEDVKKAVVSSVRWLMSHDRKVKSLKQLQGHMWRAAYKKGDIKGEVYPDVVPVIKQWVQSKRKVYIYSSGSVEAQKLLYGYSNEGDLLELFSGHFDTEIGAKVESESYSRISEEIQLQPSEILFLTDVVKEAAAAIEAGLNSMIVIRPGNKSLTDEEKEKYKCIHTFDDLSPQEADMSKVSKTQESS